jgi:opacity protein-like surface antigen
MMTRHLLIALLAGACAATAAHADERYFGYVYSAEAMPKGASEVELWATERRGKDDGHFDAQDYRLEVEHGFTDKLTVSTYANFAGHHIRGLDPDFATTDRDFAFRGLSAEFKYNVLSPYKDGVGLTLYAEPGWSRIHGGGERGTEYELELKAIVQKNFANDRLVWATNFTFEPEWEKEKETDALTGNVESEWEKELKLEVSTGLSYRVAPGWFAGVEGRYSSVYPDWTNGLHRETYAISAGPSIHYAGKSWWATATYLPQVCGGPSPKGSLALDEYEKRELRLILGLDF